MLELPNLPYNYNSLAEFGMGEETMKYHHGLHHKAYVDNGNKLLDGSEWQNKNIDEIILGSYDPTAKFQNGIFNNVAQHLNHCEFWKMMSPENSELSSLCPNRKRILQVKFRRMSIPVQTGETCLQGIIQL